MKKIVQARFEFNANQATIDHARETIGKTQAILEAIQVK